MRKGILRKSINDTAVTERMRGSKNVIMIAIR
jgi:hypothetical protein